MKSPSERLGETHTRGGTALLTGGLFVAVVVAFSVASWLVGVALYGIVALWFVSIPAIAIYLVVASALGKKDRKD